MGVSCQSALTWPHAAEVEYTKTYTQQRLDVLSADLQDADEAEKESLQMQIDNANVAWPDNIASHWRL